jgi:hypothetical protein
MAKAPAKKSAPKVDKHGQRIDAIIALLRLNGMSIPPELE